jgi:hypothetical protein
VVALAIPEAAQRHALQRAGLAAERRHDGVPEVEAGEDRGEGLGEEQVGREVGIADRPAQVERLGDAEQVGQESDVAPVIDLQEVGVKVEDDGPGALPRVEHALEEIIVGLGGRAAHGQVVRLPAEPLLEHLGNDGVRGLAGAEAEDLDLRYVIPGRNTRGVPEPVFRPVQVE